MLIFLDIDGVMVPAKSWESPKLLNDGFPAFSSKATFVVQHLIDDSTTVMLTTSHKSSYSIEEWKNIFGNRHLIINNLQCIPTNINNLSRREEIVNWFTDNNNQEAFIILDDDKSLNDLPPFLKANLVQTSPFIGLTEEHLELARRLIADQSSDQKKRQK